MDDCICTPAVRPLVVRPAEAARMIGVSKPQLYRMLRSGVLNVPRVAVSPQIRGFRVADLEQWVSTLTDAA